MPILLNRVDDRLIHGQVVIGWGRPLGLQRIILVDDAVAANDWEQDLYRMAVTSGVEVLFATVDQASARLAEWQASPLRTVVLTGTIDAMARLYRADGTAIRKINLGGVHHRPGRRERLPYLYLTDEELGTLRGLVAAGAQVSAQDVPTASPVSLEAIA